MNVKILTKQQVEFIYKTSMMFDFTDEERKPVSMILEAMDKGVYECLGLMEEEEILGYAFFYKMDKDYLFDFLAMTRGNRNKGYGSKFLEYCAEYYKDANSIIGEVEDPDFAKSDEERQLRERRMGFYFRNGYRETGVKTSLFSVDFIVIELLIDRPHSKEEVEALYMAHYKSMLPPDKFATKVRIK